MTSRSKNTSQRVLLADDDPSVRSALRCVLEQQPGLVTAGEAATWDEALRRIRLCEPDVLLLDWELPGFTPAELASRLLSSTRVIAMSGRPDARLAALDTGAHAFVSKTDPPECLVAALREATRR
jgi:DNA-binding NarL/FixJ family response regulator